MYHQKDYMRARKQQKERVLLLNYAEVLQCDSTAISCSRPRQLWFKLAVTQRSLHMEVEVPDWSMETGRNTVLHSYYWNDMYVATVADKILGALVIWNLLE